VSQTHRLPSGGRIDRARLLAFRFDGMTYWGHPGDTLASALLANGVRLVGRSFKLHRPRGIYTAGFEEPNALVELRSGARQEPNTRMTVAELFDGLEARSQNRWPSLGFDVRAIFGAFQRFMPAGFYYKTFMWPAAFWEKVYEPLIRRSAGLGSASREIDPDHYDTAHAHTDVLVVGSGAAGLAAARAAGEAGARVMLCEQDFELGGGLLVAPSHAAWRESMLTSLAAMPEVTLLPRTSVFGYYDGNVLGAIERVADHLPEPEPHQPRQRFWTIRARQVVLATGAVERLIAFPDNDRPGVMLAGAALAYVRRFAVAPGHRAVIFTTNDEGYETALALREAGTEVVAVVDPRDNATIAADARGRGIEVRGGTEISGVAGGRGVQQVQLRECASGLTTRIDADLLCVSGGHSPAVQLASQARGTLTWNEAIQGFVPSRAGQAERSAGAARGIFGIVAAARDGAAAGARAAQDAGFNAAIGFEIPTGPDLSRTPPASLWDVKAPGKRFVDLQNDVTSDDIRLAHAEGYVHIEHAKRYTTHTMATDQGKIGGLVGAAVLAEARGEPIDKVGLPTFRPYVTPVAFGAVAGHEIGMQFKPIRRTALHDWHLSRGAPMLATGLWHRPLFYPRVPGEKGWEPVLREARAVRGSVGICDVSTLGKIDVQGRDAAVFLDRLYTNTFSTLPIGRARYGLMLREDGILFDDGTTSRLAEDHFFVTTTTANAAPVLEHMEFYAQTVWPELDVQLASVTDQWAQMSVAGPNARRVLAKVVEGCELANESFPFMGVADAQIAGAPVRLFRISFSGELAWEVATPAGYGELVWTTILEAGRDWDIVTYGLEALGLMRIEKGHIAGPEINGQTTARDCGLEKMIKKKGDFVGRVNAARPGLMAADRPRLVGIKPLSPNAQLRGGAHLVPPTGDMHGKSQGWVTSATRSVELESWIGLAMLVDGPSRHGERVRATYPLRHETVEVEITSPHHVDPENARVRA
jgi:sarcosine oxidase subunit alpha